MNPTVNVRWEFTTANRRRGRRGRHEGETLVRWARRWARRHNMPEDDGTLNVLYSDTHEDFFLRNLTQFRVEAVWGKR